MSFGIQTAELSEEELIRAVGSHAPLRSHGGYRGGGRGGEGVDYSMSWSADNQGQHRQGRAHRPRVHRHTLNPEP